MTKLNIQTKSIVPDKVQSKHLIIKFTLNINQNFPLSNFHPSQFLIFNENIS